MAQMMLSLFNIGLRQFMLPASLTHGFPISCLIALCHSFANLTFSIFYILQFTCSLLHRLLNLLNLEAGHVDNIQGDG